MKLALFDEVVKEKGVQDLRRASGRLTLALNRMRVLATAEAKLQRGLVLPNGVVLTYATERPTTARHNFVSREYCVFMTPLVNSRQSTAKGRSFSYFRDVD